MKPKPLKTEELIEFLESDYYITCIDSWYERILRVYVDGRKRSKLYILSVEAFDVFKEYYDDNILFYEMIIELNSVVRKEYIDEILADLE